MRREVLPAGRLFYHGSQEKDLVLRPGPIWVSTSLWAAVDFGDPWRLRVRRQIPILRFDGRDAHIELAHLVGVVPDDNSLFEAAVAFCKLAPQLGVRGWHLPAFYGDRASDTLICDSRDLDVDKKVTNREITRAAKLATSW